MKPQIFDSHLRGVKFLFLALFFFSRVSGVILNYTCQESQTLYSTSFINSVCDSSTQVQFSSYSPNFVYLNFEAPFFGVTAAQWFVASNGFLTIGPHSMCNNATFCQDSIFNTLNGFYNFETLSFSTSSMYMNRYGGGGNWPLIGIFVTPLQSLPSSLEFSGVCAAQREINGESTLVVQYENVYQTSNVNGGSLTAQIQVTKSGVVSLLYKSVPNWSAQTADVESSFRTPYPSVGLVFSEDWLVKIRTLNSTDSLPTGFLCTPIEDSCSSHSPSLCESNTNCVLCQATQKCFSSVIIAKLCPRTSFSISSASRSYSNGSNYDVFDDSDREQDEKTAERSAASASSFENKTTAAGAELFSSSLSPFFSSKNATVSLNKSNGNQMEKVREPQQLVRIHEEVDHTVIDAELSLQDDFAYYNTSLHYGVSASSLNISSSSFQSVSLGISFSPILLPIPFSFPFFEHTINPGSVYFLEPGIISIGSLTQNCNPIWNTCPNGNYSFAILPFQTAMIWSINANLQSEVRTDAQSGEKTFIMQVSGLFPYTLSGVQNPAFSFLSIAFQLSISSNGTFEIQLFDLSPSSNCVLLSYPSPFVGLVRNTTADPMSVMIPLSLIRSNTSILFTPRNIADDACGGCGSRGSCDEDSKKCICTGNFAGEKCDSCSDEYHGIDCSLTHPAKNCASDSQTCDCPSGWKGPDCTVMEDECLQLSFNGCPSCLENSKCSFCFDSTCFNPSIPGAFDGYTCSYSVNSTSASLCKLLPQTGSTSAAKVILFGIMFLLCFIILILCICLSCCIRTWYFRRAENVLTANAVMGTSTMIPSDSTRTILPIERVRYNQRKGEYYVLGIPIQQAPLKKLYERRLADQNRAKFASYP